MVDPQQLDPQQLDPQQLDPQQLDPQQLVPTLTAVLPLGSELTHIEKLTISYGHVCWHIDTTTGQYLLKTPLRRLSPHDLNNTIQAQQLLNQYGVPSPALITPCPVFSDLGITFLIQEWLPGEDGARAYPSLSATQAYIFAQDFGRSVACMHMIPGTAFSEDLIGDYVFSSWRDLCDTRLSQLVEENIRLSLLCRSEVIRVYERCQNLLEKLPTHVEPRFTHRDLYLPNTLVYKGHFCALLDFESARFYDPLWDFVKLNAWAFRMYPALRTPFLQGYTSMLPWQDDAAQRIFLYQAIEYLAAFPYFGERFPNAIMLKTFYPLVTEWLHSSPDDIEEDWRDR